ncbi:hypothetical protein [Paraflavitalea pollutisoli]|uniref:hypothetical protein n=1 Tax=Paraflavitalea pollutisoli TaxID=3034143 RepID=UPI0023EC60A9|nr:hypothetical protein [Paraflavitalea sp. H1-2-19X]
MKKIMILLLITGAFAACGDGSNNAERINSGSSGSTNNLPVPDTSHQHTDSAGGRNNPNSNQDSLRYN